ncbi:hypothetical protein MTR_7g077600 [Medicago truncatula]|uniref:Uncharacterized protein n=1 Tax=Medicago truncatula TaxID=3880 RepID=G7L4M4_MEDTR|nr:hypothetical protein MTR_7g077600 [Medicago truncatula]
MVVEGSLGTFNAHLLGTTDFHDVFLEILTICFQMMTLDECAPWLLRGFREAVMDCQLQDLPQEKHHFGWISWMSMFVETVKYLISNDEYAEGLATLQNKAELRGDIHGIKECRRASILTRLLVVDDCFPFCRETIRETNALRSILETYGRASGRSN